MKALKPITPSTSTPGARVLVMNKQRYEVQKVNFMMQARLQQAGLELYKKHHPKVKELNEAKFGKWIKENQNHPDMISFMLDLIFIPLGNAPKMSVLLDDYMPTYQENAKLMHELDFFVSRLPGNSKKRTK